MTGTRFDVKGTPLGCSQSEGTEIAERETREPPSDRVRDARRESREEHAGDLDRAPEKIARHDGRCGPHAYRYEGRALFGQIDADLGARIADADDENALANEISPGGVARGVARRPLVFVESREFGR